MVWVPSNIPYTLLNHPRPWSHAPALGSDDGLDCMCERGFEFAGLDPATNATICAACPLGKYTEAPAHPAHPQVCKPCPEGTTTAALGAADVDECVCVPGRFLVRSGVLPSTGSSERP
jgi:hypothetical protein